MGSRLDLQYKLEELLGARHVYFQPTASVTMEYPAIKYSKSRIDTKKANDSTYSKFIRYERGEGLEKKIDNFVQEVADILK